MNRYELVTEETTNNKPNPFGVNNLEEMCMNFLGTTTNCTCEMFTLIVEGQKVNLCSYVATSLIYAVQHTTSDVIYAGIVIFISVMGILGNSLVIFAQPKRTSPGKKIGISGHHKLVNALASFDLIFSIISIVFVTPRLWTSEWLYGPVGCKVVRSLVTLGAFVAIGIIFIIAIERYYGIVHPFKTGISTKKRCFGLLVVNIVLAIVPIIPRLMHLKIHTESMQCIENWPSKQSPVIYDWSIFIIYWIIPVMIISAMYKRIYTALNKRTAVLVFSGSSNNKLQMKRLQDNRRTMRNLVAVLIAFIIFTLPNKLSWVVLDMLGGYHNTSWYTYINYTCSILYNLHVLTNPLVYTLVDQRFRRRVKNLLRKKIQKVHQIKLVVREASVKINLSQQKNDDMPQLKAYTNFMMMVDDENVPTQQSPEILLKNLNDNLYGKYKT